ncbi:energy-coupling factor transport system ATP-binding protein [Desulfonispora thiosulfatigenes DSM 11270]|uniref:Energy-coupling factor transporter ATP-binding protein EcfA2 n=1 Tax=Desulfonispora thiosulfatigenes DSM 11270 TaxID=656914 RepID=A0A1W1URG2_DESTI|nr:energy-coupling factor transporter ATPase [Desulfonispora thiosulfatigenes]SMB83660.1 energy-coupling factor transport system ATP-binding protein [Desulfonispora thiosulfatigenes DSM 11270]
MSIKIENLFYTYQPGTPFETHALKDVNIEIEDGEFLAVIGHTGSGKSTLIQHLNGLIKPTQGKICIDGSELWTKNTSIKTVRSKVGLVFQYPEHQLFEETVLKDVSFGPSNLGISQDEVEKRAQESLNVVNLDFEAIKDKSPFDLSGGQKRRVAIAGVLAMKPSYLVLDEPTAGLDPKSRDEILEQIKYLHEKLKITIILVSHSMDDVAKYADRILVMHKSEVKMLGTPQEVFKQHKELQMIGLDIPTVTKLLYKLKEKGLNVNTDIINTIEAKDEIVRVLMKGSVTNA